MAAHAPDFSRQCRMINSNPQTWWNRMRILILILGAALAGCQGKGTITGQVNFDGKPLPSGRVTFLSEEGNHETKSSAITNGKYLIENFPPGLARISVETFDPGSVESVPLPEGVPSMPAEQIKGKAAGKPGEFIPIPKAYSQPDKSGLTYTVEPGKQDHDIALKPDGP
jgi:hypothetical protein